MDLHAGPHTFKTLLSSKKTFSIPRYQREFSWGKQELNEMFNDIIKRLKIDGESGLLKTTEYFFGNIILQGDMTNNTDKEMSVIDGQQRLTAVTIFLSALANRFKESKNEDLSNGVRQYILGYDDDNKLFPILVNKTPAPFFQYKIQGMNENSEPSTEEEDRINSAYKFFYNNLGKKKLISTIKTLYNIDYDYVELLKVLRDQLLGSYVIACWTNNYEYVNLVFEIMNAKGLELASIDLIKNDIFAILDDNVPIDFATEEWKAINKNLNDRGIRVPFSTFFRHYWNSRFGKTSDKQLYKSFKTNFSSKNKELCKNLLLDMDAASKTYLKIVSPLLADYNNKNQYLHLVEILKNINDVFYVNMPRIFILPLFEKFDCGLIDTKLYESTLKFIERFHFIYNGVCSERTNRLENIYCSFAQLLHNSQTSGECKNCIKDFKEKLLLYLPLEDRFVETIKTFKYSSKDKLPTNSLCKYFLQEIEKEYANLKNNRQDSSVEHILGEKSDCDDTLMISRLLLLPRDENSRIPASRHVTEKYVDYSHSSYSYPKYLSAKINRCSSEKELVEILDQEFAERAKKFYLKIK